MNANAKHWHCVYFARCCSQPEVLSAGGCCIFVVRVWDAAWMTCIHLSPGIHILPIDVWDHLNNRFLMAAWRRRWHYSRQLPGGHYIWMVEVWKQRQGGTEWMDVGGLTLPAVSVAFEKCLRGLCRKRCDITASISRSSSCCGIAHIC